jgi:proteasome lid subunit RPN8/RPN11
MSPDANHCRVIIAPPALVARIRALAAGEYPSECCGLLIGRRHGAGAIVLTDIAPSRNVTTGSPHDSFEIDPGMRIRLMRGLRGGADALVGHYHSHPDRPATPSPRDAAAAFEPDLLWLIVAVNAGTPGDIAAFRYDPARAAFARVALGTGPSAAAPPKPHHLIMARPRPPADGRA